MTASSYTACPIFKGLRGIEPLILYPKEESGSHCLLILDLKPRSTGLKFGSTIIARAHREGYTVILLFFWLPSPEMAVQRVAARVASGGHNIHISIIYRRYWNGLNNLFDIFVPRWSLYDKGNPMNPIVVKIMRLSTIRHSIKSKGDVRTGTNRLIQKDKRWYT